jgi:hypothetical protein
MRLFELEDRPVAVFDANNANVFDSGRWRHAGIYTTRKALVDGSELSPEEFARMFPTAARFIPTAPLKPDVP